MSSLKSKISEYFLASETKKYHTNLKNFYRENVVEAEFLNRITTTLDRYQSNSLWGGTYLPNITLALGVVDVLLGQMPYISAIGEGSRIFTLYRRKKFREHTEIVNKNLLVIARLGQFFDGLVEMNRKRDEELKRRSEEGEEWKRDIHKDYYPDSE